MLRLLILPVYQKSEPTPRGQKNKNVENDEKELSTYQPFLPQEGLSRISLPVCGAKKATSEIRQSACHVQPEQWSKTMNKCPKLKQIRVKRKLNPDLGGWIFKAKTDPS